MTDRPDRIPRRRKPAFSDAAQTALIAPDPCPACGATVEPDCAHRRRVELGDPEARAPRACIYPYDPASADWPAGF